MINNVNLTPQLVTDFWDYTCNFHGTQWKYKPDAWEARVVSCFLDTMGIIDQETWMERYAFIVGKTVYIPFKPGETSDRFTLNKQISSCIHEHKHRVDAVEQGVWSWNYKYLTDSHKRAIMEARAYTTNIEMYHWYYGKFLDPARLANVLQNYACNSEDIDVARKMLEEAVERIKLQGYSTPLTIRSIIWLENYEKQKGL